MRVEFSSRCRVVLLVKIDDLVHPGAVLMRQEFSPFSLEQTRTMSTGLWLGLARSILELRSPCPTPTGSSLAMCRLIAGDVASASNLTRRSARAPPLPPHTRAAAKIRRQMHAGTCGVSIDCNSGIPPVPPARTSDGFALRIRNTVYNPGGDLEEEAVFTRTERSASVSYSEDPQSTQCLPQLFGLEKCRARGVPT